ncbi:MAG: pentapeptide repeat-containing protein [Candidatus Zixiibacteriota bacterium]
MTKRRRLIDFARFEVDHSRYTPDQKKNAKPIYASRIERAVKAGGAIYINNAVIEGNLTLVSLVVKNRIHIEDSEIRGIVKASYAQFKDLVKFKNSQFKSEVVFNSATFEKDLILDSGRFEGKELDFRYILVKQALRCPKSEFINGTADFSSAQVGATIDFRSSLFWKKGVFDGCKVKGNASFDEAVFHQKEASFIGARIEGKASFRRAWFEEASFSFCKFETDSDFAEATFVRKFNLQGASTSSCPFFQHWTRFGTNATIDLRGCTYDTCDLIHDKHDHDSIDDKYHQWKELMKSMKRLDPKDNTQPFTQLEQTFRKAGEDQLANKVYYKGRRRESSSIRLLWPPQHFLAWPLDRFLFLTTGYGVRLGRLLLWTILAVLVGTCVFRARGAVVPQKDSQAVSTLGPYCEEDSVCSLKWQESLWFSLRTFLPVEIPSGSEWKPSSQILLWILTFSGFASILKLIGWIFVPVGVAGLAGWLKR